MRSIRFVLCLLSAALLISCASSENTVSQKAEPPSAEKKLIIDHIADVPAADDTESQWLYGELADQGTPAVHALIDMLTAPGAGDDTRARYALNGLAKYVSRPGAEPERRDYETGLLEGLQADHAPAVKIFLMEQLELTGSDQAVPVLQSFIGDEAFHESAVHALRSINTNQAKETLVQALQEVEGPQRAVVIKALGDMESDVAEEIIPYVNDEQTRKAALYALAQSGDPAAENLLASAVEEQHPQAETYYLRYAERLAEEGHSWESASISREMLGGEYRSNIKSAGLSTLVRAEGEEAMDDLLDAAASGDEWLRSKALSLLEQHPVWPISDQWMANLGEQQPPVQADAIAMLGRSERISISTLRPFLESKDLSVRLAAAQAMVTVGGENVRSDLLEALAEADQPEEILQLKSVLLQLPTEQLVAGAADALPSASDDTKIALIEILADRRATDQLDMVLNERDGANDQIRLAVYEALERLSTPDDLPQVIDLLSEAQNNKERSAIQKAIVSVSGDIPEPEKRARAVLQALNEAPDEQKTSLVQILPEIGGEEALEAVVEASRSSEHEIQRAGTQALAAWPNAAPAIASLLEAFENVPDEERSELLEGYLQQVVKSKYSSADKVQFLNEALAEAASTEEKIRVLRAFAEMPSAEALQAVVVHFDDGNESMREASLRSAARILSASDEETDQELALIGATTSPEHKEKIEQYIQELESDNGEADNFTSLFNGEDLTGWIGDRESYTVRNGQIISKDGTADNLFTEEEYSDFVLKFEFKLTPGANNGLGIRSPLEGDPAYDAMELQILDNTAEKYADLEPYQYHGSVYGVAPAERGHLNPVGEWNTQEVIADGAQITVKVNGQTIVDTNIEEVGMPETMDGREHPGLLRESGHIGFLGHGDEVAVRNIRIQDLNVYYPDYESNSGNGEGMNQPPKGFEILFNGENLEGWKGLVGDPESRAEMSAEELARKQQEADAEMRQHWSVRDGILHFDGEGHSLVTEKKYKDFEVMVDWKIEPGGDSGIYLRGTPQVQIWDITEWPQGSGGLYNNQEHPSEPLVAADNPIGEWNRMRIKMIGEKVTVHLNNQLVVDDVVLENYWDRDKPIYSEGQIELQSHSTPLYFKNIFIREIPRKESLFNGEDLTGWQRIDGKDGEWRAENGVIYTEGGIGWLSTAETYDNFKLELEYRLPEGGNSGVFLRAPHEGNPAYEGLEIQLLDDYADQYADLEPWQYTGSIYDVKAPSKQVSKNAGEWQKMEIVADGPKIKVTLNDELIINTSLVNFMDRVDEHPGLKRRSGYIGLQNHNSRVEFRNITITEIK